MQGRFQWFTDSVNWVVDTANSVINTASMAITAARAVFSENRVALADWLAQSMQGFGRAISPSLYASMIKSDKTTSLWMNGLASVVLRTGQVLLLRSLRPVAAQLVKTTVGSHPVVETLTMSALDAAATLYLIHNASRGFVNSAMNNLSMAKASANEGKPEEQSDNPLTKPCEHGKAANLAAAGTSTLHYYGTLVALRAFANSVPYGELVALPLEMLLIGQSYLDYPLAAAVNCADHRQMIKNKNNADAFGRGASYVAINRFLKMMLILTERSIKNYLGFNSGALTDEGILSSMWSLLQASNATDIFVDEALTSMLSLHFIMAANLKRSEKLPGTKPGVDVFEPMRAATDAFTSSVVTKAAKYFDGPVEGDWYQEGAQKVRAFVNKPVMQLLCKLLLDDSFCDWKKFKERPESKVFFNLYGNMMLNGIRYIQHKREGKAYKRLNKANQWASNDDKDESYFKLTTLSKVIVKMVIDALASQDDQKMLAFLMQKQLEAPLNAWYDYISSAVPDQSTITLDTLEVIEDYQEKDAATLLSKTETVMDAPPVSAATQVSVRDAVPIVVTIPVSQGTNFRLFPGAAATSKQAVSMKDNTDKTLEDMARIISGGRL